MLTSILNVNGVTTLNKNQQKQVNGGISFTCHCGFTGGKWVGAQFSFTAASINDALDSAGNSCNGQGATCNGDS